MRKLFHSYLRSTSRTAQFLRFATVGAKISAIDIGGVYLLPWMFGWSLYVSRILSLFTALVVGYFLNRHFTFSHLRPPNGFVRQLMGHLSVHLLGGALNYGAFSLIVSYGHDRLPAPWLPLLPLVALWIGGMIGLSFNFVAARTFVFRTPATPPPMIGGSTRRTYSPMQSERGG